MVTGQYAGTSQAKVITKYGQLEPAVQKGTVAFRVATDRVTGFKLRKQRAQCPGTPGAVVVDVTIATMPLSGAGVAEIVELDLNDDELAALRAAAEGIRAKCADLATL